MNKEEYLLVCLSEECSEVSQAIDKVLKFGSKNTGPGLTKNNIELVCEEVNDFLGALALVQEVFPNVVIDPIKINKKANKIKKYYKYSKEIGIVKE
jgi:hypothetical protein